MLTDNTPSPKGAPVRSPKLGDIIGGLNGTAHQIKGNPFRRWWDLGYRSIIPIVPPGAELDPKSSLSMKLSNGRDDRGKAPGILRGNGLWGGLPDWQQHQTTEADLDRWYRMGAGVGLSDDGGLGLLDIDAQDEATANEIEAVAVKMLGPAPCRVGQWPKRLLLYCVDETLSFQAVTFKGPSEKPDRVELLAKPKQAVVEGEHNRTRKPYFWRRPVGPRSELTKVTKAQVETFFKHLKETLPAAAIEKGASLSDREKVNQDALKGDVELVRKAVAALPNTRELFPSYDAMIVVGQAIHAACADHPDAGNEIWHEWAERWEGGDYTHGVSEQRWTTFSSPHSVGASWLYEQAAKAGGFSKIAALDVDQGKRWFDTEAAAATADPANAEFVAFSGVQPIDLFGEADPAELGVPPAGCMPAILDRWSRDEARRKGVPVAFTALAGLAVIGAAIGCSLKIRSRLHDDREEPAALWVVLVADPGSTKSPVISAALNPLRRLDGERYRADKPKHEAWVARKRPKGEIVAEPEPKIRRSVVDDITMEAQVRVHADNPRGIVRAPDEFVGLLGSLGAYKKGAQADRSLVLRLFDGNPIMVDRVSGGNRRAESGLMGILAGTQPDVLRNLTRDLGADGLLQRCLFVLHDGQRRHEYDEKPDGAAASAYAGAVRALGTADYANSCVELSREAYDVLEQAQDEIRSLGELPGASKAWQGHVSKWGKILPRIVLIFHALDHVAAFDGVLTSAKVDRSTAERAVLFGRFVLRHSLRFYETFFDARGETSEAREIAGFILTKPDAARLSRRDIYDARKNLRGAQNTKALIAVMRELENAGWCSAGDYDASGPKSWLINPDVHRRFEQRAIRERHERGRARDRILAAATARREWLNSDKLSSGEA